MIVPLALVVDDAAFIRMRTRKLLEENGYEVEEAKDGKEAVKNILRLLLT